MRKYLIGVSLVAIGLASCDRAAEPLPATASTHTATTPDSAVENVVKQVLAEQLKLKIGEITPSRTFKELAMDDLDVVEVVMELEDRFQINIPDEAVASKDDPKSFQNMTVRDLCGVVQQCRLHPTTRPQRATRPKPGVAS